MALASPDLMAQPPAVLSIQVLKTVVAPITPMTSVSPSMTTAAIVTDHRAAPANLQGFSLIVNDTGRASVTQAALSVSFTLAPPLTVRPAR